MDDRDALDELFSVTYEELRRLASTIRRGDPNATLSPTGLVHEVWLKLANSKPFGAISRLHFKRIAGRAMRQLLVESARRRHADKRGGSAAVFVTLGDADQSISATDATLIALDDALQKLAKANPRQAQLVEYRFFGGLEVGEAAELLEVSEATALRDWRGAKAWLARQLRSAGPSGS